MYHSLKPLLPKVQFFVQLFYSSAYNIPVACTTPLSRFCPLYILTLLLWHFIAVGFKECTEIFSYRNTCRACSWICWGVAKTWTYLHVPLSTEFGNEVCYDRLNSSHICKILLFKLLIHNEHETWTFYLSISKNVYFYSEHIILMRIHARLKMLQP